MSLLRRRGYTGRVYLVIDDEDSCRDEYVRIYGKDRVLIFSKKAVAKKIDLADNFDGHKTVMLARNACWELADLVGVRYFVELDDDYSDFAYRYNDRMETDWKGVRDADGMFDMLVEFMESVPACSTIAITQGGDWVGGGASCSLGHGLTLTRKAMNSFLCDTRRPFKFQGRINEDVNAYVGQGNVGRLFFTYNGFQLTQVVTQEKSGGLTEMYRELGTMTKSFYSVMFCPSAVKIWLMSNKNKNARQRIHQLVLWNNAVPKILPERVRKIDAD
jgi:hypothetical protein